MERKLRAVEISFRLSSTFTISGGALDLCPMETKSTAVEISFTLNSTLTISYSALHRTNFTSVEISLDLNSTWNASEERLNFIATDNATKLAVKEIENE
jgi:hypothetical protein